MNLTRVKRYLDRLNSLVPSLDENAISPIETDLLKSYVRDMYDALLDDNATPNRSVKPAAFVAPAPKPTPKPEPKIELPPVVEKVVVAPPPPPPPVVEPIYVAPEPPKPKPAPVAEPVAFVPPPPPRPTPPAPEPPKVNQLKIDADVFEALFTFEEARELSERLGDTPVKDLQKAFELNERIFTVNELFGGDANAFNQVLNNLNQLNSFESAQDVIINQCVIPFSWHTKDKLKKARNFIKLVKRRY